MLRESGRFEVRRLLGRGTFGEVYLAHDQQLSRLVALKVKRADKLTAAGLYTTAVTGNGFVTADGGYARGFREFRNLMREKGVVNANVQTVDAVIQGAYEGNMVASGNVEITSTGRVVGNIETDSLVISKGGFFNGNVSKRQGREAKAPVYLVEEKRVGLQK